MENQTKAPNNSSVKQNDGDQEQAQTTVLDDEMTALQETISQLQADVKEAKEAAARANAESYNAQRRMEAETDKAKKFALHKFAKDLLDVVDNLERAIASTSADHTDGDALLEGIKLTHKSLLDVLLRHGVHIIDPVGEKFNPEHHEAVGIDPNAEADTVGVVLQKGYLLHNRLLRPAMVQVGQ